MKITFLIAQFGTQAMSNRPHIELLQQWQAQGIHVNVLTLVNAGEQAGWDEVAGIHVYRVPVRRFAWERLREAFSLRWYHYRYFLNLIPTYRHALATLNPDVIHVESGFPHGAAVALSGTSIPFSITLQGADIMSIPEFDYGYGRYPRVVRLLQHTFKRAAFVRGDSIQIRDLAIQMGCDPAKATAIPYNITADHYLPDDTDLAMVRQIARQRIVARHNLDADAAIVLSLGRLHPFKGIEYLIRAIPQVLAFQPNTQFIIAGPNRTTSKFGDYQAYLMELLTPEERTKVHFVGAVAHHETRDYCAASDVVVVPSIAEAFNRVVVEAAAIGTPSVVTTTTGVADYAQPWNAALIVPPRDASAIAHALNLVLSQPRLYAFMSQQAQRFAQQFHPVIIAQNLIDWYAKALN